MSIRDFERFVENNEEGIIEADEQLWTKQQKSKSWSCSAEVCSQPSLASMRNRPSSTMTDDPMSTRENTNKIEAEEIKIIDIAKTKAVAQDNQIEDRIQVSTTINGCQLCTGKFYGGSVFIISEPKTKPLHVDEVLMKITDLPVYCKHAFKNRETSNRIQWKVYKTALESDENILLSTPTGSGNSDVSLLCMMREIGQHINNEGIIREDSFKIIYIAPMRALICKMAAFFGERLKRYNVKVSILSGNSHLNLQKVKENQVLICTPEEWDTVSQYFKQRINLQLLKLLIIDGIHLLHDERGPVLEAVVAKVIRSMESDNSGFKMRIVAFSIPFQNTEDVAEFIRVDKRKGLFKIDSSYRPVPMVHEIIGLIEENELFRIERMNETIYDQVKWCAGKHQVLIFVHSRRDTVLTAKAIKDKCLNKDTLGLLLRGKSASIELLQEALDQVANSDLRDLLPVGFAIHHPGLAYTDRTLVEELFTNKHIQVLVSTSTLAWDVSISAHAVIIKDTQVYRPDKGGWTGLSPLDFMQMFGRAGRPQEDTKCVGVLITDDSKVPYYLNLLNDQLYIESQFMNKLEENLNAEIVMGTVRHHDEAIKWMAYSYLFIRMRKSPTLYNLLYTYEESLALESDTWDSYRSTFISYAARNLKDANMIKRYDSKFLSTEIGRIAAHYNCSYETMNTLQSILKNTTSSMEVLKALSKCAEFKNINVCSEDEQEINKLLKNVPFYFNEDHKASYSKISGLLQVYISQLKLDKFTLSKDIVFVGKSAARLMRAMFEVSLSNKCTQLTNFILEKCKEIEQKMWSRSCFLRQFKEVPHEIIKEFENKEVPLEELIVKNYDELGDLMNNHEKSETIHKYVHQIPKLKLKTRLQTVTRSTMKVELTITADIYWCQKIHGMSQGFWIFVEDERQEIIHHEYFLLKEKLKDEDYIINIYVPIPNPLSSNYFVRAVSDRWLHSETRIQVNVSDILLPYSNQPLTVLHNLPLIPISALGNEKYEEIYGEKIQFFNYIQSQCFESLYNSDDNVFIGTPTFRDKTVCAELAIIKLFSNKPDARCVYVTAFEDMAEVRYNEWLILFLRLFDTMTVKLTGDKCPDDTAKIIIATVQQWDVLWRFKENRKAMQNIQLFIADDVHLVGSHPIGTTLEIVCSRIQLMSYTRIIGLSYSLTNAEDIGEWLGCSSTSTFNFHPKVRQRALNIEIVPFNETDTVTRLSSMTISLHQAIVNTYKPVIVFIPSVTQVEETAFQLTKLALEDEKNKWVYRFNKKKVKYERCITNNVLIESLPCGVGFIHETLTVSEINIVKDHFRGHHIDVLIVSQALCWTILPKAYLVIVMDSKEYNDDVYSAVDLIQMVGRANNSDYDDAKAIIMCQSNKAYFIQMCLSEPITLESQLDHELHDLFNAEIVMKRIKSMQEAVDYLTLTFMYYRMTKNPNYYNLNGITLRHMSEHLNRLVKNVMTDLEKSKCISIVNETDVSPTALGMIASYYCIHYATIEIFNNSLNANMKVNELLELICSADEFKNISVRDTENMELAHIRKVLHLSISEERRVIDTRLKSNVLLKAHLARIPIASAGLKEDLNKILTKCVPLIHSVFNLLSCNRWLAPALASIELAQMITQAQWHQDSLLKQIPFFNENILWKCAEMKLRTVFDVIELDKNQKFLTDLLPENKLPTVRHFLQCYPRITLTFVADRSVRIGEDITVSANLSRDKNSIGILGVPPFDFLKDENWWLLVGDPVQGQLHSIKLLARMGYTELTFEAPKDPGTYAYVLYLKSDTYLGVDKEMQFIVYVIE